MKTALVLLGVLILAGRAESQRVCSTFDTGLGGWIEDETTCRNLAGVVECEDDSGGSNFVAPAEFHGNWTQLVGGCGRLCFDLNLLESGLPDGQAARYLIVVHSGAQRAVFRTPPIAKGSGMRNYCMPISLTPDGLPPAASGGEWSVDPGTNWNELIANVTALELPIDLVTGPDERMQFDNVCFVSDPPPAPPRILGPTNVCGPAVKYCVSRRQAGTTVTWSGNDVSVDTVQGPCTTIQVTGPLPSITATATRNGCSTSNTLQLQGCPTPLSCETQSFTIREHTLTPVGADELESRTVLHVPGSYERITLTLVSATVRSRDDCDGTFPLAAYFFDPKTIGDLAPLDGPPAPREVTWTGGNDPLVPLVAHIRGTLVGIPPECVQELTFCFRYRVTGSDCETCEQTVCRTVVR